jgi:uncharacterized membrane protein YkvI
MVIKKFAVRFVAVVVSAGLGAVVSPALNISLWKGALAAAAVPALTMIKKLVDALKDGELTAEEADAIIKEAE